MTSKNTDSHQPSALSIIYRFLGGATVGALALLIPLTYGTFSDFGVVQAGFASLLVISCGLLSIVWGGKFIDMVVQTLNGTGL